MASSLQRLAKGRSLTSTPFRSSAHATSRRHVWSTGQTPVASHARVSLTPSEIRAASQVVKDHFGTTAIRFVAVNFAEPNHSAATTAEPRHAEVIVLTPQTGIASELLVNLDTSTVAKRVDLPKGLQPSLTPDDCNLAEAIVKASPLVREALQQRYGITDIENELAADPWSVHLADAKDEAMTEPEDPSQPPRRLVQAFLYKILPPTEPGTMEDNQYAHPIDLVPVVDLNTQQIVQIDGLDRLPPPKIPELSVNYHRLGKNSYLPTKWRDDTLKALHIVQPDGPSFTVSDSNLVTWQGWSLRVCFNYREGLVLQDVSYQGRSLLKRASLVEMSVPYGDPYYPWQRKDAIDVGTYGIGFCANSLELGCDCLGHIHYFDVYLNNAEGEPTKIKQAICMHEEDNGILWKHVEYRNGHNESRRARELVISSLATVVNYDYLFYWRLKLDGSIDFEIKLTGELSTTPVSEGEDPNDPSHGTLVAPGVNAQVHQHMFCARLDVAVDGDRNTISEIDVLPDPGDQGPYGNTFRAHETVLKTEMQGVRSCDSTKARCWKIANAENKVNFVTGKPVAYKLLPFTRGPAQPLLLTHPDCAVSRKSAFANAHLWVTKKSATERYPAGEYPTQLKTPDGVAQWVKADRNIEAEELVVWHAFGVTHIPRVEDFPVMPCESTGFTLKPEGFFSGNPAIDLPPEKNKESRMTTSCCSTGS
jgi:primary-amine oxidase